jgi:hypothetical protein
VLAQAEALECARLALAPEESPDGFVLSNVLDERLRLQRTGRMRRGL